MSYQQLLDDWEQAKFSPPPEPALKPEVPTLTKMLELRDGVHLYTEIFLPSEAKIRKGSQGQACPAILCRSPYPYSRPSRHDKHSVKRLLAAGYAFVFQLTRGQGMSEGVFRFLQDDIDDGYDTVQWISGESWCNGNVGMTGSSYLGSTQLLAARAKPPALKCIMPTAFVGNAIRSFPYSNGVPNKGCFMQWLQLVDAERWDDMDVAYGDMSALNHRKWGKAFRKLPLSEAAAEVLAGDKLDCWRESFAHPQDNDYWQSIHFTDDDLVQLDLPIFFTDGWYDMTIGPIDFFTRMEQVQAERSDRYLLVGPWDHYQTFSASQPKEYNGDRVLPDNGAIDMVAQRLAFFDRYLKKDEAVTVQKDRVRVYISGSTDCGANDWFDFSTLPTPNTEYSQLYLHSQGDARSLPGNGLLSWVKPTSDRAYQSVYHSFDQYIYDPSIPTASKVESFQDRRDTEIRSDVLTYTSEPFKKSLTILGEMTLVLYASSNAPDTDWFTIITEVYPDGKSKSFHYAPPAFRARYRKGFDREVFLSPDEVATFSLSLGPAGHQIRAGNRLRLSIFSSAFPEYEPNTNSGNPANIDTKTCAAKQTVFHDSERPTHIILPVIYLDSQ